MAGIDAIAATSDAMRRLLDSAASGLTPRPVVAVQGSAMFQTPPDGTAQTVGIWLHRVTPCAQRRAIPMPPRPDGEQFRPAIAVDLHFMLVAWASDPIVAQRLLAWAVRTIEDTPELPPSLLNGGGFDGTFGETEGVDLCIEALASTEEMEIWQVAQASRQPAVAYIARQVAIESRRSDSVAGPVEERDYTFETAVR